MNAPENVFANTTAVAEHPMFTKGTTAETTSAKTRLQNTLKRCYPSGEPTIDVSKRSIIRLREFGVQSLTEARELMAGGELLKKEIYWDGYIRAIEHILEMENE